MDFAIRILLLSIASHTVLAQLVIDVVGESMCGDTTRFIERQMMPVYNKYKSYIMINYYPYGPTEETDCKRGKNGMKCTCQHGKEECDKNALQSCVLRNFPENALETVACIQGRSKFKASYTKCIASKFSPEDSDSIYACATNSTGATYMAEDGAKIARAISKDVFWVPWISIKGKRIVEAERHLEKVLCKTYIQAPECSNY